MVSTHKAPTANTMEDNKIYLYYASEENGYEEDCIAEYATREEAIEDAKAMAVATDFLSEEEVEDMTDGFTIEGENGQGYHIVYMAGMKLECLPYLYGLQEDFGEMFEDEEEE